MRKFDGRSFCVNRTATAGAFGARYVASITIIQQNPDIAPHTAAPTSAALPGRMAIGSSSIHGLAGREDHD
jgi:hypothetical protein